MPAKSEAQRRAAALALRAKGRPSLISRLRGPARSLLSMTKEQLRDFARKKRS